ncbi:MAG TPA: DNRLRE domain-containing protein [Chitinophaga sp.]
MKHQLSKDPILLILAIVIILSSCTKELNNENAVPANQEQATAKAKGPHSDTLKFGSVLGFLTGSASVIGLGSNDRTFYPSTELMAGLWTVDQAQVLLYGFFFTTQALGPTADGVKSAYLMLYSNPTPLNGDKVHANSGPDNAFYVQRVSGDWDIFQMDKIRWNNQPGAWGKNRVLVPHTNLPSLDVVVDVTALVKDAIIDGENVIGFRLTPTARKPHNIRNFVSCYHERTDLQPRLIINYN